MGSDHELLSTVTDLEQARIERLSTTDYQPLVQELSYETRRSVIPLKHAGMVIRAVVTEPIDTTEHLDKPAIIIKHGFMASRPAYNDFARQLAAGGNRVVHYGMPRTSALARQYHPKNLTNPLRTHSQAINGVTKMLHERYPNSPEQHDLIGHSMGGLAVSEYIGYRPHSIRSALLIGSAGLAKHSFAGMTQRAIDAVNNEIVPFVRDSSWDTKKQLAVHSLWHVGRNPLFLLREGYQAATGDAFPGIDRARESGVKVGAMWMSIDTFFPLHEIDTTVTTHFDETLIIEGNHLAPQEFPKQTAQSALVMLNKLSAPVATQRRDDILLPGTIA